MAAPTWVPRGRVPGPKARHRKPTRSSQPSQVFRNSSCRTFSEATCPGTGYLRSRRTPGELNTITSPPWLGLLAQPRGPGAPTRTSLPRRRLCAPVRSVRHLCRKAQDMKSLGFFREEMHGLSKLQNGRPRPGTRRAAGPAQHAGPGAGRGSTAGDTDYCPRRRSHRAAPPTSEVNRDT